MTAGDHKVTLRVDLRAQPGGHRYARAFCTCGDKSGRVPENAARAWRDQHDLRRNWPLEHTPPPEDAA